MTKPKQGGKRANSGRKLKYGEETKVVSFRIPLSIISTVKDYVNLKLKNKSI